MVTGAFRLPLVASPSPLPIPVISPTVYDPSSSSFNTPFISPPPLAAVYEAPITTETQIYGGLVLLHNFLLYNETLLPVRTSVDLRQRNK